MTPLAVAGIPSVDLSRLVDALNQSGRCVVTNEARTFAYWYHMARRAVADPWLLHPNMSRMITQALESGGGELLTDLYRTLAAGADFTVWGDAHAHYLDPLDKPGFHDFFFKSFHAGIFVAVIDDPALCVARLLARNWVPSSPEAVDVVARHLAQTERLVECYPDAAFVLDRRSAKLARDAQRLVERLGVAADVDGEELGRRLTEPEPEESFADPLPGLEIMLSDRLTSWRRDLRA